MMKFAATALFISSILAPRESIANEWHKQQQRQVSRIAFVAHSSSPSSSLSALFAERKPLITGNWKLNPETKDEAIALARKISSSFSLSCAADVGLFVPYPFLESVQRCVGDKLFVGAELIFPEKNGAFTGAVSPSMVQSLGIHWSLAGHSERRSLFGETDEDINKQCLVLVERGMNVVLCVGETLEEFEKNLVNAICEVQLKKGLAGISAEQMSHVVIAYEPVWAIGTGKVATPEIAQGVHSIIRSILAEMYDGTIAQRTRILYGGSVTPESVDGLLAMADIDGALVGGASLDGEKFGRIINFQSTAVAA